MPRPKSENPNTRLHLSLPTDLVARMDLMLYSELEGRVPYSARGDFIAGLLHEAFARMDAAGGNVAKENGA